MKNFTFHLLANAHLDPVWFWDWREGLNEGLITCATILDLMDEHPYLTFIRGEASIYAHIERTDPALFQRIKKQIEAGRWDVVGGTWVQPDTNLTGTESLLRHFDIGRAYFAHRFGAKRVPTIAWAPDSFGHSAGLPDILHASGMNGIMFGRPARDILPIAKPVFWWEGSGGARVLASRPLAPYLSEHDQVLELLDRSLEDAKLHGLSNVAFSYGVGNHGGGPTRRQLRDLQDWARRHPEVRVIHSGMHRFFAAVRREIAGKSRDFLPVHRGELNFCLRGCYASVAKFKFAYRKMEASLSRAETTTTLLDFTTRQPARSFESEWHDVLFNSFHDILPGSSIERAYDDQLAQAGRVLANSQEAEFESINRLAAHIDTRVEPAPPDHPNAVPVILWNPHPHPFEGPVEMETSVDYRPVFSYTNRPLELPFQILGASGKPCPHQIIATEHDGWSNVPWRKRVVTRIKIPACGWTVCQLGWVEGASNPEIKNPARAPKKGVIDNGIYRVEARAGTKAIKLFLENRPVFPRSGLSVASFDDPYGSWGGKKEEPDSFQFKKTSEIWEISHVETLESGPERATLWIRFSGRNSRLDLTLSVNRDRRAVDCKARLFINERSKRIKMVIPLGGEAEFDVPGGMARRSPCGEVPGGRWVRVMGKNGVLGFASDGLYSFDVTESEFRPTLARATRFAATGKQEEHEKPWMPSTDSGELRFQFLIQPGDADLARMALELEQPPIIETVPPGRGKGLPREGSMFSLSPPSTRMLALRPDGKKILLRIQQLSSRKTGVKLHCWGESISLGTMKPGEIATWQLSRDKKGRWMARKQGHITPRA